jgi:hypothetical protein
LEEDSIANKRDSFGLALSEMAMLRQLAEGEERLGGEERQSSTKGITSRS